MLIFYSMILLEDLNHSITHISTYMGTIPKLYIYYTYCTFQILLTAWLLRLGEVTKQSGLVVIASHDGSWGKEELEPTLTEKRYNIFILLSVSKHDCIFLI